ncbi:MAG: acylneuraminate cytidylyltransferase family protein [Gammaproteobacteria bacterium]|nr:acylneuraminate cytidylyltransferase family protein [Gammaproteobacteria bacterium]
MPDVNAISVTGRVLALIPARSGSKGIPDKNKRYLVDKPLLAYAIESACRVGVFGRVLLTTDNQDIAHMGRRFGAEAPFLRPTELAADDTPMLAVLQHAIDAVEREGWIPEIVVLLQPTAPFRRDSDLIAALSLLQSTPEADSVVSVELVPSHYSPHYVMRVEHDGLVPFLKAGAGITRRQDAPQAYSRNGQFYIIRRTTIMDKNSIYGDHAIPFVTSHNAVNLDTMDDWEAAERLAIKIGLPPR